MKLKIYIGVIFLLGLGFYFSQNYIYAEQVPENITLSDSIYADLAVSHQLDNVSVYYFDQNINDTVRINSDKSWVPASTIKLYAAMYMFDQIAAGKFGLYDQIVIDQKNVAPSFSDPKGYAGLYAGQSVTVYRLLDQMITQSDNTSFNTLLDLLGREDINTYIHDLGLINSSIGSKLNLNDSQQAIDSEEQGYGINTTNASDFATAFILINGERIPGSSGLFAMLSRQRLNSMIPKLLPKNIVVAHKTGELDPYYHDGGIVVTPDRRYVLSVFSNAGDPNLVAHISDLIYTGNADLVGSTLHEDLSEAINQPIDPLVTNRENESVLGENTQNIKAPSVSASDLGIRASDLSSTLTTKQLPKPLFIPGSFSHIIVDVFNKVTIDLNPIPSLRAKFEVESIKLKLAEARNFSLRGKVEEQSATIAQIDQDLVRVSKEKSISDDISLQTSIKQISETRFSMLSDQLANLKGNQKTEKIKEIAQEARNTLENVHPFIPQAIKQTDLSQKPLIGEVVKSTANSITIKTIEGNEVTTQVDQQTKTRGANDNTEETKSVTDIKPGTVVALLGVGEGGSAHPAFILTDLPQGEEVPTTVTVLKVNLNDHTMVVSQNGVPVQVDLNNNSIIKGADTIISLDQLQVGSVVVVHGEPVATQSGSVNSLVTPTPAPTFTYISTAGPVATSASSSEKQTLEPEHQNFVNSTSNPINIPNPTSGSTSKPTATTQPVATNKPTVQRQPEVIKGKVVQVVKKEPEPTKAPEAPKTPEATKAPEAKPVSTPAPTTNTKK